jgi:hypothetical protein
LQRAETLPIWKATNTGGFAMMTRDDRNAIDGLFQRLEEAERRGGSRDAEAEAYIQRKIAEHPAAPYYLAQTVVVQQEALKEAERRIEALEREERQIEQRRGPWDREPAYDDRRQNAGGFGGGGFLAGAAQTALGVAGGMMLGSLIGSIFTSGAANASEFDRSAAEENSADTGDSSADAGGDDGGGFDAGGFGDGGGFDMGGDF